MKLSGRCYCGELRYEVEGEPVMQAQCHCRECQYITGGAPNLFMMFPREGFRIVQGAAKDFARKDLEKPVTRQFCPECGTHVATQISRAPMTVVKVGTLDDPSVFSPAMAIFACDRQPYHLVAEGLPVFDKRPG
ncbi:GFA family protein [Albimonas sp. CAU 1670]|uniref:GFA family protein n=1 Tax=Albimonas sp. CAU 1670 TaxID=3032599 RepID=UPI0023DAD878|nr:GFA family protein [Albimonas sp. CAU 1670]MDF2235592.1 GFA family protein [Albimonas sp. CAU 1670]